MVLGEVQKVLGVACGIWTLPLLLLPKQGTKKFHDLENFAYRFPGENVKSDIKRYPMGGTLNNNIIISDFKFIIDYVAYRANTRFFVQKRKERLPKIIGHWRENFSLFCVSLSWYGCDSWVKHLPHIPKKSNCSGILVTILVPTKQVKRERICFANSFSGIQSIVMRKTLQHAGKHGSGHMHRLSVSILSKHKQAKVDFKTWPQRLSLPVRFYSLKVPQPSSDFSPFGDYVFKHMSL